MPTSSSDTLLLTGFEAFGKVAANPSEHIVKILNGEKVNGCLIKGLVLPVVFAEAGNRLITAIEELDPKAVVCLGVAEDRAVISVERLAVNIADARIPDNAGNQPVDEPVDGGGPAACWSTLPVKSLVSVLTETGVPACLSMSAGTYVCNEVFYRVLRALENRHPVVPAGFIHLPLPEALGEQGLETLTSAVRVILAQVSLNP